MLSSYAAILRNDRLEWETDSPHVPSDTPIRVQVTLLDDSQRVESGKRMAEALERLAQAGGLQAYGDPVELAA